MTHKRHRPKGLIVTGVLIVAVALAGALVYGSWNGAARVSAEELTRVLIVAAAPDETGAVVGQIIAIADVRAGTFEAVSPALEAAIPGTSYSTLADAYPFGGGRGTAEALARAQGEEPLPYVAIDAQALRDAVTEAGGLRVTLRAPMSVFDGEELYTFETGAQTLDAAELGAVLKGAPYRTAELREKLDAELATGLLAVLAASPETLAEASDTNLSPEAVALLQDRLESGDFKSSP